LFYGIQGHEERLNQGKPQLMGSISDYTTAPICESELPTPFTTAEVCPTEVSIEYDDAECRCKPENYSSPKEFKSLVAS
jgi:hypothetical protein